MDSAIKVEVTATMFELSGGYNQMKCVSVEGEYLEGERGGIRTGCQTRRWDHPVLEAAAKESGCQRGTSCCVCSRKKWT
jgi:hypothetical protein